MEPSFVRVQFPLAFHWDVQFSVRPVPHWIVRLISPAGLISQVDVPSTEALCDLLVGAPECLPVVLSSCFYRNLDHIAAVELTARGVVVFDWFIPL